MTPVVVSRRADADVDAMLEHLADLAGPAVFPESGARCRSLGPYARIAVVAPYVVVYDYQDNTVVIVRVLDGRRDITRRLVRQ